jgi:ferric-dicitrate binding protein FerR (iron transport regulator)
MRTRHRRLTVFGLMILTGFSALAWAADRTPNVIGKVVSSSNATVEGSTLLSNGTILSGDAVSVGEGGAVLLNFSPGGRAVLAAATQVRFSSAKGNIEAQLLSGTVAVERENQDGVVVKTSTHRFQPQGEGRAEFLVALYPDQRTIVEAQHGKLAITDSRSGESYTLAEGLRAEIPASATGIPGQQEQASNEIGKVATAAGATRNGKPLATGQTVVDNDLISTGAAGRAVVQLSPTNQITLNENTSARFSRVVERIWLRVQSGNIVAENKGESYALIVTAKFHIEPNSNAASRIYVGVMTDNSTYIESVTGDVRIEEIQTEQAYLLPSGQNTLVPANASGVPGLQPLQAAAPAPTPTATTPTSTTPTTTPTTPSSNPQTPSVAAAHSHTGLIILGAAAGGGIAAAAAGLAGKGGSSSSQPVSPSTP